MLLRALRFMIALQSWGYPEVLVNDFFIADKQSV